MNWDNDTLVNSLDVVNGGISAFRNFIFDVSEMDSVDIIESLNFAKTEIDSWINAVYDNKKFVNDAIGETEKKDE